MGPRRPDADLKHILTRFLARTDLPALVRRDPVELVHRFDDPHDQEVAGFIVGMLAYGRVASIRAKAEAALRLLGPSPSSAVDTHQAEKALEGFVHRFQSGTDLPRFVHAMAEVRREYGSLGAAFLSCARSGEPHFGAAMDRFVLLLRGAAGTSGGATARSLGRLDALSRPPTTAELSPGLAFLLPRATLKTGAAKRLCLFLRWMVRPADGVDLGTWRTLAPGLEPSGLIIPLDTHVHRIGRYLGLTERRSSGFRTALEITESLRRLAPDDPLVFDLALCHLGISGRCPRRRDVDLCRACPIRGGCRLGEEPQGWSARSRSR